MDFKKPIKYFSPKHYGLSFCTNVSIVIYLLNYLGLLKKNGGLSIILFLVLTTASSFKQKHIFFFFKGGVSSWV